MSVRGSCLEDVFDILYMNSKNININYLQLNIRIILNKLVTYIKYYKVIKKNI